MHWRALLAWACVFLWVANPLCATSKTPERPQDSKKATTIKTVPANVPPPQTSTITFQKPLTLEAAISIARENYPSLREAAAKIEAAKGDVDLARTAYLPRSDLFLQTNWASANQLSGLFVPMPGLIPVAGGNISQDWHGFWGNYDGLVTSWTAYDFGYRHATLAAKKSAEKVAIANRQLTEFDVVAAAANAFLQAATADSLVKTAETDVRRSQALLTMVSTLAKSGLRPGADEAKAMADLAEAKTRLIKAQEQARLSLINLAHTLGRAGTSMSIDATPFLTSFPDRSPIQASFLDHPAVQAELSTIQQHENKKLALSRSYWPKLNIINALTGRGSGYDDGHTLGGLKGTYPTLMNYAFAVSLNYSPTSIFEAHAKERTEQGLIEAEKAKYDELIEQLKTADAQSREMIDSAMQIAQNTPIQVHAARMANLQITRRYQAGLATLLDVAEAQRGLTQAEIDNALAKLGVWSAFLGSTEAKGTISPFLNLVHQYQALQLSPGRYGKNLLTPASGTTSTTNSAITPFGSLQPNNPSTNAGLIKPQNSSLDVPASELQPTTIEQPLNLPSPAQVQGAPLDPSQIPYSTQSTGGK